LGLDQADTDDLLSAADLAPSTAPELSLHPRDETLYRIAQELESLRNDPQLSLAQVRFVEESLLLVLRGARAALPAIDVAVVPSGAPTARTLSQEEQYLDDLLGAVPGAPGIGEAVPFPVLAAVARSPRWALKRRLAEALPRLIQVDVDWSVSLVKTLRSDPPDVEWRTDIRRRVIEAVPSLWRVRPEAALALLRWREGDEVYAGLATLDALTEIADDTLARAVRKDILSHVSEQDQPAVELYARALQAYLSEPDDMLTILREQQAKENRLTRICIARSLCRLLPAQPAETLQWMQMLLRREEGRPVEHQNVRRALARDLDGLIALLAGAYDEQALALLRSLAADEDVHVRRAVSDALPKVVAQSDQVALDLIQEYLLQDRDQFVHERTWATLRRLMRVGSERAEELCARLIEIA
jgi:hypothetical protein